MQFGVQGATNKTRQEKRKVEDCLHQQRRPPCITTVHGHCKSFYCCLYLKKGSLFRVAYLNNYNNELLLSHRILIKNEQSVTLTMSFMCVCVRCVYLITTKKDHLNSPFVSIIMLLMAFLHLSLLVILINIIFYYKLCKELLLNY